MDDTNFYKEIRCITPPWYLHDIVLKKTTAEVEVFIDYRSDKALSPECGKI